MRMPALRQTLRSLARNPTFSLVAVFTLALAIGANTAIFSIVESVLLRPLPLPQADRLVRVYGAVGDTTRGEISPLDFSDFRRAPAFASLSAWSTANIAVTGREGPAERLHLAVVSDNFFETLAVAPAGRGFTEADARPEAERVAVISDALWRRRFGAARDVVGRTVDFGGRACRVVGIAPRRFSYPGETDVWSPLRIRPADESRGSRWLYVTGRLRAGVSVAQADAQTRAIADGLAKQYPDSNARHGARTVSLLDDAVGDTRRGLLVLAGAVGFVLLIACTTLANLFLSRALRLRSEMSVRMALGASRAQLAGRLLAESLALSACGGVAGLALAFLIVRSFVAWGPEDFPRLAEIAIDPAALGFTLLLVALTALLFGTIPALQSAKKVAIGQTRAAHTRSGRLRALLVISQTALALVTLFGALLFTRSFVALLHTDPGFRREDRFTADLSVPYSRYQSDSDVIRFYQRLIEGVKSHPDVSDAAAAAVRPIRSDNAYIGTFHLREKPLPPGTKWHTDITPVTPGYLSTLGIALRRGRPFDARDTASSPSVAIVSEAWVRRFAPDRDPIGMHFLSGISFGNEDVTREREIVGIAGDVRQSSLGEAPEPMVYVPHAQAAVGDMSVFVRMKPGHGDAEAILREEVARLDRDIPLYSPMSIGTMLSRSVGRPRMYAAIVGAFAILALVLAIAGIYGVLSFLVEQRRRELGVRLALGATPRAILGLVLRHGGLMTATGTAIGCVASLGFGRMVDALLFGTSSHDPSVLVAVVAIVLAAGAAASSIPAWRAARIDPAVILRNDT